MNYPETPGYKKAGTSKAAADSMRAKAPTLRDDVLHAYSLGGSYTADEVADMLGKSLLSIRPRVTELIALRLITDSGKTRPNQSGKQATVWRAV